MPNLTVMSSRYISFLLTLAAVAACASSGPKPASETAPEQDLPATGTASATLAAAPDGGERFGDVLFDKTVHQFGDILTTDGPQTCTFTLTNLGDKPIAIYEVVTSCGCTEVTWTKTPVKAGETATITATYANNDGAFPFDKTLTVYVSGIKKPVTLHLRGVVREKPVPLAEAFPLHFAGGRLGMRETEMRVGNILQGLSRSDEILLANLSDTPLSISVSDVSKGLSLSVSPQPVPPHGTATLRAVVQSDSTLWGKRWYTATLCGDAPLRVFGYTFGNFEDWTDEQRLAASLPQPDDTTFDFGVVPAGTVLHARFRIANTGRSPLVTYAVDPDHDGVRCSGLDRPVAPGESAELLVDYDTRGQAPGENLVIITLTTNTPLRPIVNLFLAGAIR